MKIYTWYRLVAMMVSVFRRRSRRSRIVGICLCLALCLLAFMLGCAEPTTLMYSSPGRPPDVRLKATMPGAVVEDSGSLYPFLQQTVDLMGDVPISEVLDRLSVLGALAHRPTADIPWKSMTFYGFERCYHVTWRIERATGWLYDPTALRFYEAPATHPMDEPDDFGNVSAEHRVSVAPRAHISVSVRFQRLTGSLGVDAIAAGGGLTQATYSLPDGIQRTISSTTERSFFQPVRTNEGAGLVGQDRGTVSSGFTVSAIASRLPGGYFRISGSLEISAFVGGGLDRAQVSFPLDLDAPRHQWITTAEFRGGDIGAQVAFRHFGVTGNMAGETWVLQVRAD